MRISLTIDSATEEEMRDALLAWHFTSDLFKPPGLELDGLVVKVMGAAYTVESPPIHPTRAAAITEAVRSKLALRTLGEDHALRREMRQIEQASR